MNSFWTLLKVTLEGLAILLITAWCLINGFWILTEAWF